MATRVNLVYRFDSEDKPPLKMRLKIEINSREHFTELGLLPVPIAVDNQWFRGQAVVSTFAIDELLGTKLRALYQRKKGRDLFDLWFALERGDVNTKALIRCFERYMTDGGHAVTGARFEANLLTKAGRPDFRGDMDALLRPGLTWSFDAALKTVMEELVARLPGEPWKDERTVRGRILWDKELDGVSMLNIDGRDVTWEELGRMMMSCEGWQFRLEIKDPSDEV